MPLRTLLLSCVFIFIVISLDDSITMSPYKILKSNVTDLLNNVISAPGKLADHLFAYDLIGEPFRNEVKTTPSLSQYDKASKLVNTVLDSLKTFNEYRILLTFCDILKEQDDPNLCRIAITMIRELGMIYINNLLKVHTII